jgi:hypothetical protein
MCNGETEVREEVESLLRSYEVAGSFMESPAVAHAADALAQKLTAGQRIKHYQIVNLIGGWAKFISRRTRFSAGVWR